MTIGSIGAPFASEFATLEALVQQVAREAKTRPKLPNRPESGPGPEHPGNEPHSARANEDPLVERLSEIHANILKDFWRLANAPSESTNPARELAEFLARHQEDIRQMEKMIESAENHKQQLEISRAYYDHRVRTRDVFREIFVEDARNMQEKEDNAEEDKRQNVERRAYFNEQNEALAHYHRQLDTNGENRNALQAAFHRDSEAIDAQSHANLRRAEDRGARQEGFVEDSKMLLRAQSDFRQFVADGEDAQEAIAENKQAMEATAERALKENRNAEARRASAERSHDRIRAFQVDYAQENALNTTYQANVDRTDEQLDHHAQKQRDETRQFAQYHEATDDRIGLWEEVDERPGVWESAKLPPGLWESPATNFDRSELATSEEHELPPANQRPDAGNASPLLRRNPAPESPTRPESAGPPATPIISAPTPGGSVHASADPPKTPQSSVIRSADFLRVNPAALDPASQSGTSQGNANRQAIAQVTTSDPEIAHWLADAKALSRPLPSSNAKNRSGQESSSNTKQVEQETPPFSSNGTGPCRPLPFHAPLPSQPIANSTHAPENTDPVGEMLAGLGNGQLPSNLEFLSLASRENGRSRREKEKENKPRRKRDESGRLLPSPSRSDRDEDAT